VKLLAAALVLAGAAAHADSVVIDFTVEPTPQASRPLEANDVRKRFPHPHAKGKTCDPNRPNTPPDERMGGQLLPTITTTSAAITRKGAQVVYLIDYCPTGVRVPRTRRLLVLDGTKVVLDKELPAALLADELLAAVDIDGDGFSELVTSATIYRGGRNVVIANLVRASDLKVLGTWTAIEHCSPGSFDEQIMHRVTFSGGRFRDVASKRTCHYPP
jgi:hypothetical protein